MEQNWNLTACGDRDGLGPDCLWLLSYMMAGVPPQKKGRPEERPSHFGERVHSRPARSPASRSYFGDDLTFVNLFSKLGIHVLPSTDISSLLVQLMESGAKTIVPLVLACFSPRTRVPE